MLTGSIAGGLIWGFDPVTLLSGTVVSPGRGLVLLGAGTLAYLMPVLALAAIAVLLSTVDAQLRRGAWSGR